MVMTSGLLRSAAENPGTLGGATGWSHTRRRSGVSSGPQVPVGNSGSGTAIDVLPPTLSGFVTHTSCSSVGFEVRVLQTLFGPEVGVLGSGVGSCLLVWYLKEELWDRVAVGVLTKLVRFNSDRVVRVAPPAIPPSKSIPATRAPIPHLSLVACNDPK